MLDHVDWNVGDLSSLVLLEVTLLWLNQYHHNQLVHMVLTTSYSLEALKNVNLLFNPTPTRVFGSKFQKSSFLMLGRGGLASIYHNVPRFLQYQTYFHFKRFARIVWTRKKMWTWIYITDLRGSHTFWKIFILRTLTFKHGLHSDMGRASGRLG